MARIERGDDPGSWHHVMNRGIARRTVFEGRQDVRFFLSRVARCVRGGVLQIHAYSILTTHYHALVRSPQGELSRAMQRIQNAYVRWFNRSRRRDGPLFRGRFCSRPVTSEDHWHNVIRYIDHNAVEARIAHEAAIYPHGSAFHYARHRGPIWLTRGVVEEATMRSERGPFDPRAYASVFGRSLGRPESAAIGRRIQSGDGRSELELSSRRTPAAVRSWMIRKAALADGTTPGHPLVSLAHAQAVLAAHRRADPKWRVRSGRVQRAAWPLAEAVVLHRTCGLRHGEIADLQGCARSTIHDRIRVHDRLSRENPQYEKRVASLVAATLRQYRAR